MNLDTPAIVVAVLPHGEHGAVVRALTPDHGLRAGYVRGGRSRKLRPVLQPGNGVLLRLTARTDTQLAAATVELTRPRAALGLDALDAAMLGWLTALTASVLGEDVPHPRLYAALDGLLDAAALGGDRVQILAAVARYELLLLAELGFGLDLSACAATGATAGLAYVSPRSSRAVSAAAGAPYAARLLPLPALLTGGDAAPCWRDVAAALRTTGHFVEASLLPGRLVRLLPARQRLAALVASRAGMEQPGGGGL